ncbi:MAG: SIS domain-containing protein, partial [Clostridia bacterium]|nr:SIS domain-containing protein [Clostridia bacterium]
FESYARMPAHVECASEFRYAPALFGKGDLVIVISQSGETADSLAALRLAKQCGAHTLAIVNVIGSSIAREANNVLYTWAGPEISVCSTKAYTVQAALITLIAAAAGLARGTLTAGEAKKICTCLHDELPEAIAKIIKNAEQIKAASHSLLDTKSMFFIGRGADTYLASEGSLKLKEITYTHSEAYAAGELKHGTISLIEEGTPVVSIANDPAMYEKMLSNIREVKARGAKIIAVCSKEAEDIIKVADHFLEVPDIRSDIAGIAAATSLQLLAYYLAAERGLDVDKPRNLAKSVTVE